MAIELSSLTFTDEDDIVPVSGIEEIFNTGIANTLAGDDIITGTSDLTNPEGDNWANGISNLRGIIDTGDGNDTITGIHNLTEELMNGSGIFYVGTIDSGNGDDIITGIIISEDSLNGETYGIYGYGTINTGEGNDTITGITQNRSGEGILSFGNIDTGKGNDIIIGSGSTGIGSRNLTTGDGNDTITGTSNTSIYGVGLRTSGLLDTGDGDDIITGNDIIAGISDFIHNGLINSGIINTGNGTDSIISLGKLSNRGGVLLGDGNDSITAYTEFGDRALENFNFIDTGDGNDTITTTGLISNEGIINTGNGNDSFITNAGFFSLNNNGIRGRVFLGEGEDYLKGFGSGDFYGGNGNDILELTPGSYRLGWADGLIINSNNINNIQMIAYEFETLKAGSTTYNFSSLTSGQIIVVA
jgi:hypothetical protein